MCLRFTGKKAANSFVHNVLIDDITITVAGPSGISEINILDGISVFSDNLNNQLKLDLTLNEATDLQVRVIGMSGKVVMENNLQQVQAQNVSYNTEALSSGIYTVIIDSPSQIFRHKVMID